MLFPERKRKQAQAMKGQGTIQVTIATEGATAVVAVRDTGPGIAADIREKIFTPFFTTKAKGTGLGLSTVRKIVEAHGGTITVQSEPGIGTRFDVRLNDPAEESFRQIA